MLCFNKDYFVFRHQYDHAIFYQGPYYLGTNMVIFVYQEHYNIVTNMDMLFFFSSPLLHRHHLWSCFVYQEHYNIVTNMDMLCFSKYLTT
jgi:hypothetical protein